MPAYRFKLELAGQVFHGVMDIGRGLIRWFPTEAELDRFCAAQGLEVATAAPADSPAEQLRRGRPSFDAVIAAAVSTLKAELAGCGDNVSACARLVLRYLAKSVAAEDMPSTGKVRAFLTERSRVAKKSARKSARKSKRARIRRVRETLSEQPATSELRKC